MFIHDYIKIMYTNMGYLPGHAYHLVSDKEMFDAFLSLEKDEETEEIILPIRTKGFFGDCYHFPIDMDDYDPSDPDQKALYDAYEELVLFIQSKINDYLENGTIIPNWIYSYMIMSTITYDSDEPDIAYIREMIAENVKADIDMSNALAEFTEDIALACLSISKRWIMKQISKPDRRPPTIFGEPHVVKSLRLDQANVLLEPITTH